MEINQNYFKAIKPVLEKLKSKVEGEFVVFGSSPLYLLGILEFEGLGKIHDLDVVLDGSLKEGVEAREVHFENDPKQKLYKVNIDGLNVDIGTRWPGYEAWFGKIFRDPMVVDGFKFANLQVVLEYKEMNVRRYNRKKDREAVARIKEHLGQVGKHF